MITRRGPLASHPRWDARGTRVPSYTGESIYYMPSKSFNLPLFWFHLRQLCSPEYRWRVVYRALAGITAGILPLAMLLRRKVLYSLSAFDPQIPLVLWVVGWIL